MASPANRIGVAILGLLALSLFAAVASANDHPFMHPGGAYKLTPPAGWGRSAFVDEAGCPFYVFSPDAGTEPRSFARGIWVTAYPVPTDDDLEKDDVSVLAAGLLQVREPGLTATLNKQAHAKLGPLPAAVLDVEGKHGGGPWRGRMLIAVQADNFLVVLYGCPPGRWAELSPTFEQVAASVDAPVPAVVRGLTPIPARPQESRELTDRLTPALPLIDILAKPLRNGNEAADGAGGGHGQGDDAKAELSGWGSSFVITPDGYLITNRHVVHGEVTGRLARDSYDPVEVAWDQSLHRPKNKAVVVAVSYLNDLALLKLVGRDGERWPTFPLADLSAVRKGDSVMVCGWPHPQELGERDLSFNNGTLNVIEHDARGRAIGLRHSARTTAGNSGGPLYDLNLGGVIGVHSRGILVNAHDLTEVLYHGAVPIDRVIWEYPQLVCQPPAELLSKDERAGLIAYYFMQKRFGAALLECQQVLADNPRDGLANAYKYRMAAMQASPVLMGQSLKIAMDDPRSRLLATLFAARSLMEQDRVKEAAIAARDAIGQSPRNFEAHLLLGLAQMGQGQFDDSAQTLQQASDLAHGQSPEAEDWLGYLELLRWTFANQVVRMPWTTQPPAAVTDVAVKHFERSYKMWPSRNWFALSNLGVIKGFMGQADEAANLTALASQSAPGDPDLQLALAYYMCVHNHSQPAIALASAALEAHDTPRGHCILAWGILLSADDTNKAGNPQQALKLTKLGMAEELHAAAGAPDAFWAPAARKVVEDLKPLLMNAGQ